MKGGVWKNAEDETLKAAVMKYGLNNWSRVASLLVRKTARQCKARWYEWLDPSVKKTPWSKDEDEKLLHMAKILPTQWKSIAVGVGRTANQCLERYNELLDLASGKIVNPEDDPRKLRPGEVDPNPESKPARADPMDLDEDEKEMLAEARARLANTRGKKAKRKARERQLEEARRVALLQKRRELKAAGISVSGTAGMSSGGTGAGKRKGEIDYENEIPFEHKPMQGFHHVGAGETPTLRHDVANMRLQQVEEFQAKERMRRLKMQDRRALRKLHEQDLPTAMAKIAKEANPFAIRKRTALALPEPVVTDSELMGLVESLERASNVLPSDTLSHLMKSVAGTTNLLPTGATDSSLASILAGGSTVISATPSGVIRQENIMREARNAIARTKTDAVLEGTPLPNEETIPLSHQESQSSKKKRLLTPVSTTSILTGIQQIDPTVKKVKKTTTNDLDFKTILSSLPDPDYDVSIGMKTMKHRRADRSREEEEEPVEDERDRERRILRHKESMLDDLARINRRVRVFQEHYPRPLDLPGSVSEIAALLKPCNDFWPTEIQQDAAKILDQQTALLLLKDNEFLSPDDHLRVFANPQSIQAAKSLDKSFLVFTARILNDITFQALEEADTILETSLISYDDSITEFSIPTTDLLSAENNPGAKLALYVPEKQTYIAASAAEIAETPALQTLLESNIIFEVDALNKLREIKAKKLKRLRSRQEMLQGGYKSKEAEIFHVIGRKLKMKDIYSDKLFDRQKELDLAMACQDMPLIESLDLPGLQKTLLDIETHSLALKGIFEPDT